MPFFGKTPDKSKPTAADSMAPADDSLKEGMRDLVAAGEEREIKRAISEAESTIVQAARNEVKGITLIERGRCPQCTSRTEDLLFTVICPTCGWFRRRVPETGRCTLHLKTGSTIVCDRVFEVQGDQFLCVTDGVVRKQVMRSIVEHIDYDWNEEELEEARSRVMVSQDSVCSWCQKSLDEAEPEGPFEEFVAFGTFQERYLFCSDKCQRAFRKQYPARVHRNCYETDCEDCDECAKKYNTKHFKRRIIAPK